MADPFYDPQYEFNDTRATAALLAEGTFHIAGTGVDWYRIEALSGQMSFAMTPGAAVNLNMELYNAAGQVVRTAFTPTGGESFSHLATTDATWFLKVYRAQFGDTPPAGLENDYSLTIGLPEADPVAPGDVRATAPTLAEGTRAFHGLGTDWHRIETPSGLVSLTMTPLAGTNLNLELYNAAGQVVAAAFQAGGLPERVSYLMPADGVLYARVYNAAYPGAAPNGTALDYSLTLDLPEVDVPGPGDTRDTAVPLAEGTRSFSGIGVDWHRIDTLSGRLALTMTPGNGANLNLELYNAAGQVVATAFQGAGLAETISYQVPADGVLYARVYHAAYGDNPPNGTQLNYTLTLDLPEADTAEPGDTRDTAVPLAEGTRSFSGIGVDWHRIDTLSGRLALTMTPGNGANLNLELYNAAGQVVATAFQGAGLAETISYQVPADGVLYARVYHAAYGDNPPNGTQLNYTLTLDLPEADTAEPGDTRDTAVPLAEGTRSFSGIGVDWHRIDTLSGRVTLTMTPLGGSDLNVVLYNAAGEVVAGNAQGAGQAETVSYLMAEAGVLYARVATAAYGENPPNGTQLNYRLALDLPEATVRGPNDPGETRATATVLTHGSRNVTGTGLDWFRVEIGPGQAGFSVTPRGDLAQNLNLTLFDANGNPVATDHTASGTEAFTYLVPAQGTYYLQVANAAFPQGTPNGVEMTYRLTADLPQGTWSTVLPFGPVGHASVGVYDIDGDGRDEIVVGTTKALDAEGNEVRPAGLIVLEDDGTVKWSKTFPAVTFADLATGKTYQTTSVSTAPVFSDVNGDGKIDIVVGLGAADGFPEGELGAEGRTVGQPGDKGGVVALDGSGNILWSFTTGDSFGDDNRPDGVYGAPTVFDLDGDGVREVIFAAWDHYLYVLDGRTGTLEKRADLHDTAGASPTVADLNGDGQFEIVMPSDITNNPGAGLPQQGGILHVFNKDLQQTVAGWTTQVGTSTNADFRGKFEHQSLWSTAQVADLDRDGRSEIVVGTGNFFKEDGIGEYVKVWNADGSLRLTLATEGRTLASPLVADLDGDGRSEIVAATIDGHVHAWRADGSEIFDTRLTPYGANPAADAPIRRAPVAVDLNGDGKLEILVSIGSQVMILDAAGRLVTDPTQPGLLTLNYQGSPVVRDIDRDGRVDIITGGNVAGGGQAVVHRFENPLSDAVHGPARTAEYQEAQNLHEVRAFVERFYTTILGRASDAVGGNDWTDKLSTGILAGADVARGFTGSLEFTGRGLADAEFVETLYRAFFNRAADQGGLNAWLTQLDAGVARAAVVEGFIGSREFSNLAASFGIRAQGGQAPGSDAPEIIGNPGDSDVLKGGAGGNVIHDGQGIGGELSEAAHGLVYRLYGATLGRAPDPGGFLSWLNGLSSGSLQPEQTAAAFVNSREFQRVYGALDDAGFVALLYRNVLGREGSEAEIAGWVARMTGDAPLSDAAVVLGFADSREYVRNSTPALDGFMREADQRWNDVIEGGAGNDTMNGGLGSDTFVFRRGQGGQDVIRGFEAWDNLQLSGFGFRSGADARAAMAQVGTDVVFTQGLQTIRFENTTLADMARVRFNVS
jgi:hypothetical protein